LPHLRQSFRCYQSQTYPNREMVIVCEGSDETRQAVLDLTRSDRSVQYVFTSPANLGKLRNMSVEAATGKIIVQWDDDDLYSADRLVVQYKALVSDPAFVACYLTEELHYFANTGEVFWTDWAPNPCPHTLMAWKDRLRSFYPVSGPDSDGSEDGVFLDQLMRVPGRVCKLADQAPLFIYVYHGANTWAESHHRSILDRAKPRNHLIENEGRVRAAIAQHGLGPLKVMGVDGLAFRT
jgi:glycosyltransferase involved in cell wall biosynthesis